jgi:hypothetical protein
VVVVTNGITDPVERDNDEENDRMYATVGNGRIYVKLDPADGRQVLVISPDCRLKDNVGDVGLHVGEVVVDGVNDLMPLHRMGGGVEVLPTGICIQPLPEMLEVVDMGAMDAVVGDAKLEVSMVQSSSLASPLPSHVMMGCDLDAYEYLSVCPKVTVNMPEIRRRQVDNLVAHGDGRTLRPDFNKLSSDQKGVYAAMFADNGPSTPLIRPFVITDAVECTVMRRCFGQTPHVRVHLCDDTGKTLVLKRTTRCLHQDDYDDLWDFPGRPLRDGEHLEGAAVAILDEQLGLRVEDDRMEITIVGRYIVEGDEFHITTDVVQVRIDNLTEHELDPDDDMFVRRETVMSHCW